MKTKKVEKTLEQERRHCKTGNNIHTHTVNNSTFDRSTIVVDLSPNLFYFVRCRLFIALSRLSFPSRDVGAVLDAVARVHALSSQNDKFIEALVTSALHHVSLAMACIIIYTRIYRLRVKIKRW